MSSQIFCPLLIVIYAGLYELFIYFGYELLISHVICKYFLPFRMLCFFMCVCVGGGGFLCCAKLVSLSRSHLLIFTLIFFPLGQQSPTFLAPGTGFMEDSFSMGLKWGRMVSGWIKHIIFIMHVISNLMPPLTWQEIPVHSLEVADPCFRKHPKVDPKRKTVVSIVSKNRHGCVFL